MAGEAQEKTEKATPKKRDDARKKGQVLKSAEVNTAVMVLSLFAILAAMAGWMMEKMMALLNEYMTVQIIDGLQDMSRDRLHNLIIDGFIQIIIISAPLLAVSLAVGIGINLVQVGFMFTGESIKPKFSHINPFEGVKRIFSMRSVVELIKSLLKITIVGVVVYIDYLANMQTFESMMVDTIAGAGMKIFDMCLSVAFKASLALIALGLADYLYQWWEFEKNLKMSKQEIKDEYKMVEGDPKIKQAIKQRQREMAMRRMMSSIPKADVVITNPTHYAIALEYKDNAQKAPTVVAKGKDLVAQRIKDKAREHGVPMVENKPVAQALYVAVEVGDEIPQELFGAVAEVLAYVYQQKQA